MALISPLDFTGLPLMARIADRKPIPHSTKTRVNVQLMLPPDASIVEAAANHARLEFAIVVNTPSGERYTGSDQTAEAQLTPATVEKIRHFGLTKNFAVDLAPGEYTAHVVARDDLSGRTGSVAVPIMIE